MIEKPCDTVSRLAHSGNSTGERRTLTRRASEGERSTALREGSRASVRPRWRVGLVLALFAWNVSAADEAPAPRDALLVRVPDDRPRFDPQEMEKFGIRLFESRHLKLFTDIDSEVARPLPKLIDQVFDEFEKYFGKLPPAADGNEFQVNGYLIKETKTFQNAGLLDQQLRDQQHGRQIGYQFWMMDQPSDYYRRHLLIHEMTHAFMLANPRLDVPVAYLEGMAEHFGTHRLTADGKLELRLMPNNRADFRGHDRLYLIRKNVKVRDIPELLDVMGWEQPTFRIFNESYPWAWGACVFLDQLPRTRDRFRKTARSLFDPQAWKKFEEQLQPDSAEILTEWTLFAAEAWEGFDFERMAIDFRDGQPLNELIRTGKKTFRTEVRSDRGWQSSGVVVEKGRTYELVATGRFALADKPKPWVSEADGITFRYHNGRPLGQLLTSIRASEKVDGEPESMLKVTALGTKSRFESPCRGTLYLRLNDHPGELADNKGTVSVEFREIPADVPIEPPNHFR